MFHIRSLAIAIGLLSFTMWTCPTWASQAQADEDPPRPGTAKPDTASVKGLPDVASSAKDVVVPPEMAKELDSAFNDVGKAQVVAQAAQAQLEAKQATYRATYFEIMAMLGLKPEEWELKPGNDRLLFVKRQVKPEHPEKKP